MHGRVKVYLTEEQKIVKRKQEIEKIKVYKEDMKKIFEKRDKEEFDKDLMDLTAKVLLTNPDIMTLWHIRKQTLLGFKTNCETPEELAQWFDNDLALNEHCLKTHPESYPTWYHRQWVLKTRDDPKWEVELAMCNGFLIKDGRNMHTWEHRRFVATKANKPMEEELTFTAEVLNQNCSNSSAWSYRSHLLARLHPDLDGASTLEESHHKSELKMVLNASYDNPDESSPWFYQRWLADSAIKATSLVNYVVTPFQMTVSFNRPVDLAFVSARTRLFFNNEVVHGSWQSYSGMQYNVMWFFKHSGDFIDDVYVKMEFDCDDGDILVIQADQHGPCTFVGKAPITFKKVYSPTITDELKNTLESNRYLLELEPNDKWTTLTITFLLHCLDPKRYLKECIKNLEKLKIMDELRVGHYDDLITKWSIEDQLIDDYQEYALEFKINFDFKITSLPHMQYYSHCQDIDLSNQRLKSNCLTALELLQNCRRLSFENNELTTLRGFPFLHLETLNLRGNKLNTSEVDFFVIKCTYDVIL